MIKKFNIFINEALGISFNFEEQCNAIFRTITSRLDKSSFIFNYTNTKGSFRIKIKIDPDLKNLEGRLSQNDNFNFCVITIKNRNDKATLFHEMKHFDFYINKKDKNIYANGELALRNKDEEFMYVREILYLFDPNEFESRYHDYYIEFNNYLVKNLNTNPNKEDISREFKNWLSSDADDSIKWYFSKNISFSDYISDKRKYFCFYYLLDSKELLTYKGVLISLLKDFRQFFKKILNINFMFSKEEKRKMDKIIIYLEKDINKKRVIYKKKILRLITIMCNKWIK